MAREMKPSGIEWIGEIPREWEVSKVGSLYTQRIEKVSDKDFEPLSVTMQGVLPQLATAAKTDDGDNRKLVRVGDFAINSRSDRRGSCGISPYDGSVSLINIILTPRNEMHPGYYNWLFHTELFADEFYKWGHGIVDDLWTTRWQEMKSIAVPVPDLSEQSAISSFLDRKCAEIDAVIEKTKAAVEEYKKLKQSVITEAVTKGVRGPRPMKPSGVEWIGDVPEGWEADKVKHLFTNGKGLSITKENLVETGLPVISYGQIHSKNNSGTEITDDLLRYVDFQYQTDFPQCEVFQYDFVFADTSEDYDGCGNCAYKQDSSILFGGYHTIILHSNSKKDNKYFAYLFKTNSWRKQLREVATGVKLFTIAQKTLMNSSVIIPPESEQQEISDYLDRKCAGIDNILAKKQQFIKELEAYKKSLIYEYVTGKKEVKS